MSNIIICDFCRKEIKEIYNFKIIRTDINNIFNYDMTGFHNKDICKNCLIKLKDCGINET